MNKKIDDFLNTDNWFNYQEFYDMVANKKEYKIYVEVGVWKGHSISYLANKIKKTNKENIKIYAVDLFEDSYQWENNTNLNSQFPIIYEIYNKNLSLSETRDDIIDLKGFSWEMSSNFEDKSIDFIYIDADHEYESVVKDINAWLPKLKIGGMISGHDYPNFIGVKKAVDEIIKNVSTAKGSVWYKIIE